MQSVKAVPQTTQVLPSYYQLGVPNPALYEQYQKARAKLQDSGTTSLPDSVKGNSSRKTTAQNFMKRRKNSPKFIEDIKDNEKGYKTTENSKLDLHTKTLPSTPQDVEMEDQDDKPLHKDSLELPQIQPTRKLMPQTIKPLKLETPKLKHTGNTFQKCFLEKFSVKNFAAQLGKREMNNPFKANLIRTEEKNYLNEYWFDYFNDLRQQEIRSMVEDPLKNHPENTKYLRAHFVNWIFHVNQCLDKKDTTLPYLALNLMDRFYKHQTISQSYHQLQLNGVTCLFIVSKVFEIVPIDLPQMIQELCRGKYSDEQFLDKETEILHVLGCEIDSPHLLEFVLFYIKLIKFYIQELMGNKLTQQIATYIDSCEEYAVMYVRVCICDMIMMSIKPSILAATSIVYGLFVSYRNYMKSLKRGEKPLYGDQEIKTVVFAWNEISSKLLQEANPNELDEFMREISERLSYIGYKYGKELEHIFVKELMDQLPKFNEQWNEKIFNQFMSLVDNPDLHLSYEAESPADQSSINENLNQSLLIIQEGQVQEVIQQNVENLQDAGNIQQLEQQEENPKSINITAELIIEQASELNHGQDVSQAQDQSVQVINQVEQVYEEVKDLQMDEGNQQVNMDMNFSVANVEEQQTSQQVSMIKVNINDNPSSELSHQENEHQQNQSEGVDNQNESSQVNIDKTFHTAQESAEFFDAAEVQNYQADIMDIVIPKPETFMQKRLKEYEMEMYDQFGSSSLDWKPKLSKLEQAKINAIQNRNDQQRSKTRDTKERHLESWKIEGEQVPSLDSLLSTSKAKMTKLEQEKEQLKKSALQPIQINLQRNIANTPHNQNVLMEDSIKKKSKLELEKENSKKRVFGEISNNDQESTSSLHGATQSKRAKLNDYETSSGTGFMSDAIRKKSRLELEKEAAIKARNEEKENILRSINQHGLVMKFDPMDQPFRNSKSPRSNFTSKHQRSSVMPKSDTNLLLKRDSKSSLSDKQIKTVDIKAKNVNGFKDNVVHEVDPALEQTMILK
ncbi:n-terminal domain containing protein [Stylonychia lemnae]|uniref:N-terminal domain containing protein n=1 Tax=Stylonychia lemnae TaxID=5949 RepID=A0A078B0S7_STYLE|nr:n-terminal domain containing protein [Stylonychia lemnae]|eukprot:CDW86962.1 n-terminal domain containing protein [Stylonychia lemnae]